MKTLLLTLKHPFFHFLRPRLLALALLGAAIWSAPLPLQGQFAQTQKLTPPAAQRQADARFGISVAVEGSVMVVGAPVEAGGGAAYVYEKSGGTWQQTAKLVATDRAAEDYFGFSVSVSGSTIVVGAVFEDDDASGGNPLTNAGSAYVFEKSGGTWQQVQKLVATDRAVGDQFGITVSVSGSTIAVGADLKDDATSGDNPLTNAGSAYVFEKSGGTWQQTARLVAADRAAFENFGVSVSVSGSTIAVGADLKDDDASGGNPLKDAGSAYVFEKSGSTWQQTAKLVAADRAADVRFGYSVSVSGSTLVVGAVFEDDDASGGNPLNGAGAAYVFEKSGGVWQQTQKLVAADRAPVDRFGITVSVSGNTLAVGADLKDDDASGGNPLNQAGSAYVFGKSGGTWQQTQKLVAADRAVGDQFGITVSVSGNTLAVGAYSEDDDASGGNPLNQAGSAYVFEEVGCEALNPSTPGRVCRGDSLAVTFSTQGPCPNPAPGTFVVQLSNATGSFATPTVLGNANPGTTRLALPTNLPLGSGYQVRIVTPTQTSPPSALFAVEGPTLADARPAVGGAPVCRGGQVTLTFSPPTGGCGFPSGSSFTAQLSNFTGSFGKPLNLGPVVPGQANSLTIPASLVAGSGYRIRVVSGSPSATSSASLPFQVKACASRLSAEEPELVVMPNPASRGEIRCQVRGIDQPQFILTTTSGRSLPIRATVEGAEWRVRPTQVLPGGVYVLRASEGGIRLSQRVLLVE